MELNEPLTSIKGVGEVLAKKYHKLGIYSIEDLIYYTPRRYDDYSEIQTIAKLRPGTVTIKCRIQHKNSRYVRRGMHITEAIASDETGSVRLVWFNQPYRAGSLLDNVDYYIRGEFGLRRQHLTIQNPAIEKVSDFPVNAARIVPTYKTTKGLTSLQISKTVRNLVPYIHGLSETLPDWILNERGLIPLSEALMSLHFPNSIKEIDLAKERLGFEEVFSLTLAALLNKYESKREKALNIPFVEEKAKNFVKSLAFELTDSQRKIIWQIYKDMQKTHPMNRMIEGDVGSGKTVVACMAALMVMEAGYQVALMAPTEVLARQHAETLHSLLDPMKLNGGIALLVGSMSKAQKESAYMQIKQGKARLIIGTHALIQEGLNMHNLGLVIIDEQHRFGVEQRKALQAKAGHMPHVLSLTATPIPRSLALTLYGELDISLLTDKPAQRKPVITKIISPNSRAQLYDLVEQQLKIGHQAFFICPLINDSETTAGRSVDTVFTELDKRFKQYTVSAMHGKIKAQEKEKIMQDFFDQKIGVLVSTTVIEVGIDIPNATVIVIEDAERFGLAQIHQLRGRVGRDVYQSYCYLISSDSLTPSRRLRALEQSNDGFKLAELDLDLRGPGAIYGTFQHGALDMRFANLSDMSLISNARIAAQEFIDKDENLLEYKVLHSNVSRLRSVTNLN